MSSERWFLRSRSTSKGSSSESKTEKLEITCMHFATCHVYWMPLAWSDLNMDGRTRSITTESSSKFTKISVYLQVEMFLYSSYNLSDSFFQKTPPENQRCVDKKTIVSFFLRQFVGITLSITKFAIV